MISITFVEVPSCAPCDLEIIKVSSSSLAFSFSKLDCEELNGPLTGYEYKVTRDGVETVDRIDPAATTCVCMLNMKGVTNCSVSVAALNEAGVGKHCSPLNVPLDDLSEESDIQTKNEESDIDIITDSSDMEPNKEISNDELIVHIRLTGKIKKKTIYIGSIANFDSTVNFGSIA